MEGFQHIVITFISNQEHLNEFKQTDRIQIVVGLVLIMIAAGGLRPSVLSFSEEQFSFLRFSKKFAKFLVYCYVLVNLASLISATTVPYLRDLESCRICKIAIHASYVGIVSFWLLLLVSAVRCFTTGVIKPSAVLKNMWHCIRVSGLMI